MIFFRDCFGRGDLPVGYSIGSDLKPVKNVSLNKKRIIEKHGFKDMGVNKE